MRRLPVIARLLRRAGDARRACATAYRAGGFAELRRLVSDAAYWRFHPRVRRWAAELPRQRRIDQAFDERYGVDTAGEVSLADVGVVGNDIERGHGRYRPVWTRVLHDALGRVPSDLRRFTFVDYGSGKGKALLLASDHPFEEIIGVEFALPLHETAKQNIATYSSSRQRCRNLRSECIDALTFVPPPRPLVCFFFNPFDDSTMAAVLARLVDSAGRDPRDIFVIYSNMRDVREHEHLLKATRDLRLVVRHPQYLIFRIAPPRARASDRPTQLDRATPIDDAASKPPRHLQ